MYKIWIRGGRTSYAGNFTRSIRERIVRAFVEFYENYARETGCMELRMDTNEKNTAAMIQIER